MLARDIEAEKINETKEMEMPRLVTVTCKRCEYKWVPRVSNPTICPRCRSAYWNKPRSRKITKRKKSR